MEEEGEVPGGRTECRVPHNLVRNTAGGSALAHALRCHFYQVTFFFFLTEPPFNGSINKSQTLVSRSLPPHHHHHGLVAHSPLAASRHPDRPLWELGAPGGGEAWRARELVLMLRVVCFI